MPMLYTNTVYSDTAAIELHCIHTGSRQYTGYGYMKYMYCRLVVCGSTEGGKDTENR